MPTTLSDLVPFGEVGRKIPGRPTLRTLHRWRTEGRNGKRLNTVRIGGKRFVSMAAVLEFMVVDNPDDPSGRIRAGSK
jgi:hypothetical protein